MAINGKKDNSGYIFLTVIVLLFLLVISRIIVLQFTELIEKNRYDNPNVSKTLIRGNIYDRNGTLLAIESPVAGFSVTLNGASAYYIGTLVDPYLKITALEVAEDLTENPDSFFAMDYIPSDDEIDYFNHISSNLGLDNQLKLEIRNERNYISDRLSKVLLGNVDSYMRGTDGIEKYYNKTLEAKPSFTKDTVTGSNLVLTVDYELLSAILDERFNSNVAILNNNGEILAFSSPPKISDLKYFALRESDSDGNTVELGESVLPYLYRTIKEGRYYLYSDEHDNTDLERLKTILISLGRIPNAEIQN